MHYLFNNKFKRWKSHILFIIILSNSIDKITFIANALCFHVLT